MTPIGIANFNLPLRHGRRLVKVLAGLGQFCGGQAHKDVAPQSPGKYRWLSWYYYSQGSDAFKGDLYL